jgi:hypothetical protein
LIAGEKREDSVKELSDKSDLSADGNANGMRDSDVDSLMKLHQYSADDSFEEYKQILRYNTISTRPPNKVAMGQDPKKNRGILTSAFFSNSQKLGFLQKMNTLNSKRQIGSKKNVKPGCHDIHVISRRKNFQSYNELF